MQSRPKKKRVLIADDAQATRRNTRVMLSMVEDVEVVAIALDGTQAIEMAQQHKPDIVILDLNMPRVNGLAAYKKICESNPQTACIIISAEKDAQTLQAARDLGIQHYLIKPFTSDELDNAVRDVIQTLDQNPRKVTSGEEDNRLRQLADEYMRAKRTDEEAVKVFEEAIQLPDCELSWMQTLAMIYVVRQRWGKLKVLAEKIEHRTN